MDRIPSAQRGEANPTPLVSVVIPAYNCEKYVREAIDSVLAQTFGDFELIVVNDAATDSTPEILSEYERAGKLRVVTHEVNRGLSGARNSGIREARGTYVTFLDADDIWRPEKLEYQAAILRENPDLILLSNREMFWTDGEDLTFPPLPEKPELQDVEWKMILLGDSPLSVSNAIVRRDCLNEVGRFDERLRAAEDRDLWMRILRRYRGKVASGVVDAYRRHGGNMSADPEHMKGNVKLVLRKTFREVPCSLSLRARARAFMYLDLAIVCYEADQRLGALDHALKSLLAWPFPLRRGTRKAVHMRWIWLAKILLGRERFERWWRAMRKEIKLERRM